MLRSAQVVLSHTPFRQLSHLKDKPVLLAGLGSLREVRCKDAPRMLSFQTE